MPALTALTTGLRLHKSQAGQALTHLLGVTRAVAGTDGLRAVGDVGQALQSLLSREDQEAWTPDGALTGEIAAILASFVIDAGRLTEQATPAQLETVRRRSREIEAFFVGEASLQEWLNAVLESLPEPAQPPPITQSHSRLPARAAGRGPAQGGAGPDPLPPDRRPPLHRSMSDRIRKNPRQAG
jgi:hypothetical protein